MITKIPSRAVRAQLDRLMTIMSRQRCEPLSTAEVAELLGVSLRIAQRRIRYLRELGLIDGDGRLGYRIVAGVESWECIHEPPVLLLLVGLIDGAIDALMQPNVFGVHQRLCQVSTALKDIRRQVLDEQGKSP